MICSDSCIFVETKTHENFSAFEKQYIYTNKIPCTDLLNYHVVSTRNKEDHQKEKAIEIWRTKTNNNRTSPKLIRKYSEKKCVEVKSSRIT